METVRNPRADQLDPAQVASLGRMEIVARWVVEGFLQGLHRSPRKGFSVEFAEYRQYQPGDDLRYMDWKVVARADKWMIKQFEEETNLRAAIVLDVSKSMDWKGKTTGITKLQYAEQIVASISLLLLKQKDAVGLVRYDDQVRSVIPPKARTIHWRRLMKALEEPGGGGDSQMGTAMMHAGRMVSRPGIVILVSDLLVDPEATMAGLRAVRAGGHDVTVLHILDRSERELDLVPEGVFADTETNLKVPATASEVREAYRRTVDRAIQEWRDRLSALGVSYEVVFTDEPFGVPLRKAFAARQRLP
ncbi:MAG: DUF58 domain-containing protein [Gemmatimonadetes bacterium]|nr:DUF58 domain-containing protein [Gemmatimonadota bacterium]